MEQGTGQGDHSDPIERRELRKSEGDYTIGAAKAARAAYFAFGTIGQMTETRAARLLAKAIASEAAAQLATDRAIKQAYLDIAKQWRELTDQAEGLDNSAPDRHRS